MLRTVLKVTPQEAVTEDWLIVDVRSASERKVACVAGSMHVPLETVEAAVAQLQGQSRGIALLCKSGMRAGMAQQRLERCGLQAAVIEGGIDRWIREGLPVARSVRTSWSLERQVRLGAGLLIVLAVLGTVFLGRGWLWLAGFVGCGLVFAGASDICMMGNLLALMPWNRVRS